MVDELDISDGVEYFKGLTILLYNDLFQFNQSVSPTVLVWMAKLSQHFPSSREEIKVKDLLLSERFLM